MTRRHRIVSRALTVLLMIGVAAGTLLPQIPPDRDALLNGDSEGMAAYAEANGYPAPLDVLAVADELGLTAKQKYDIREMTDEIRTRARVLGKMIVKVEEELHFSFNSGMIGQESVEDDAEAIGKMRGTLRGIHLSAYLKTKELLTAKQFVAFTRIRNAEKKKAAERAK
jgi:Spy/CpxP family protein refolding chaperone